MSKPILEVQMVEVGGRGGVYQHSLAACIALSEAGHQVTLHTSSDPEIADTRIKMCLCFNWYRDAGRLRSLRIGLRFVLLTLPHVLSMSGTLWIQGLFKTPLTFLALILSQLLGRRALFSPHTLFTRHGGRLDQFFINKCLGAAKRVVVYNDDDAASLRGRNLAHVRVPLSMYTPVVRSTTINRWKKTLADQQASVCSVGQIRSDKNLTMLVDAAVEAHTPLIIIGPDTGAASAVRARINMHGWDGIVLEEGYFPLEDLAAIIALTGTVALPYSVASQSAVAVLAQAYGAKVLAYGVGGLTEQADIVVDSLATADWANALTKHAKYEDHRQVPLPPPFSGPEQEQLTALILGAHE